jgi:hypothetical protein
MSSRPKKGRPRRNLDWRTHERRVKALERRKGDLAKYQAGSFPEGLTDEEKKVKLQSAIRDIAGLEKAIQKGPGVL